MSTSNTFITDIR